MITAVTGATGFIGRHLTATLREQGDEVRIVGGRSMEGLSAAVDGAAAVIHLAGETVAQRWTAEAKRRSRDSRIEGTRKVVAAIEQATSKPAALLCASAVGFYGSRGDETLTEASPPGTGFLAELVTDWEAEARCAEKLGLRVVILRFGIVLGRDGGAFPKMAAPLKWGVGGKLGPGKQWMPWIHIDDVVGMILFALRNGGLRGPLNVVSPNPATNADFTQRLAAHLHRPALFPVPAFALRLLLGEMAEAVLSSARVVPAAAAAAGYRFACATLDDALFALTRHPMGEIASH